MITLTCRDAVDLAVRLFCTNGSEIYSVRNVP